ncbi:MAG TPA: M28 family peptidase [Gemmatimonadales bacterium]|nr:M28 family peptidase [Gemmatimonadales bacterium]
MRSLAFGAALALSLPSCAPGPAGPPRPEEAAPGAADAAWWGHVTALADDSMLGREAGSPQYRKAADYVAAAFRRAGLEPSGGEGYLQPVPLRRRQVVESRSSVALVRSGREERLVLGTDAAINLRSTRAGSIDGPLVFVGSALRAPEAGIDDLAGVDLRGKVAVVMSGYAPKGMEGPALAAARGAGADALLGSGAIGVVGVYPDKTDLPWDRYAASRLHPQMRLARQEPGHGSPTLVSVTLSPAMGERLFAGSSRSWADLLSLADAGEKLPTVELPVSVRATVAVDEGDALSHNVVGVLRGSDPALRDEFLVLTAHLDHLGTGEPVAGDSIFNGAMDNASGIATLIETAALVARRTPKPKRSVAFVAVTGEEHGLLGSDAFAGDPPLAGPIIADLNTDMYLPINPLRKLLVNGLEESDLADDVRRAAARVGVEVITDPEPERNAFVRSDQFSFIRRGIPALSLKVGFALGTPEHERVLQWRKERYHGVEDEVTQPVNHQTAAEFNRLYAELVMEVANRATRPAWYPASQFRPEVAGSR